MTLLWILGLPLYMILALLERLLEVTKIVPSLRHTEHTDKWKALNNVSL